MAVTRHEARGNAREPDGGNAGTRESKYQYLRYCKYDLGTYPRFSVSNAYQPLSKTVICIQPSRRVVSTCLLLLVVLTGTPRPITAR